MKLSIITINYKNLEGLKKTVDSVLVQTYKEFEYIVIDGGSCKATEDYLVSVAQLIADNHWPISFRYVSEPDNGIYNAINKGIHMAASEYIQILNSGDIFASDDVVERMMKEVEKRAGENPAIVYGNMIRYDFVSNKAIGKSKAVPYSLRQYYTSTMNHDCCWIQKKLFEEYGYYDEQLKIVSDWKWFLQVIGMGYVNPVYVDIDMTKFDCSGISETNMELRNKERRQVLKELLPPAVLADYDKYAFPTQQIDKLQKYHLWGIVYFVERVLFKLEKWGILH